MQYRISNLYGSFCLVYSKHLNISYVVIVTKWYLYKVIGFFLFFLFETGSHYVVFADLELSVQSRLVLNL